MTAQPWSPPAARRPGPWGVVALGAALALAAGFFAFGLTSYLNRPEAGGTPVPTAPATPAPSPSDSPSPSETPTASTPTPAPPTGPADDFDPPPLPYPQSWDEAKAWLEDNRLYGETLAAVDCAITRLDDPRPGELAALDAHLAATMECLMRVWSAPMATAGFVLPQSPVLSYDQPITTACGTSPSMDAAAAFYCPADQRIFYAVDRGRPLYSTTPLAVDNTLAHEVGHALQGRTGVLMAEWAFQQDAEPDLALEYNRRTELQADCLGGLAINALATATGLTEAERELLGEDTYARGDHPGRPRTHGAPASGLHWITTGLSTTAVAACNTFVASPDEVA